MGENRRSWISVAQDGLIQVVLPLAGGDGRLVGYIEGFYRLAPEVLLHQREQIRNGVLMAAVSALATGVALYPLLLSMFGHAAALSDRLMNANFSLVHALGKSIAKRDIDTDAHNYRVTLYAAALAEEMGVSPNEIPHLVIGAFLHDVGRIGIPDHILQKPGRLSAEEFEVMKTHTLMGLEIIAGIHWLEGAAEVIRHHLRIPSKLDSHSTSNWTRIPRQTGQSARNDAGVMGFTPGIPFGSSVVPADAHAFGLFGRQFGVRSSVIHGRPPDCGSFISRQAGGRRWVTRWVGHCAHCGLPFLRSDSPSRSRVWA